MKTEDLIAGKNGKGLQFQKNILMLNKFDGKKSIKKNCSYLYHHVGKFSFFYAFTVFKR